MSCNYAQNLSPYENKGKLGLPEIFDDKDVFESNCKKLVELLKDSNHTVFHTGAGISTSAGIPDFRGPNGVWTLEKKGKTPSVNVEWEDAKPTKTHMALLALQRAGYLSYIVTQNIDGLHLRSGIFRNFIAELHGNLFTDKCGSCLRQYVRPNAAPTVGQKCQGISCPGYKKNGRRCRGKLYDTILDWEDSLPDEDFDLAYVHSMAASLSVCLGTSLQIVPSGTLPVHTKKRGGKLVICNLQPTKQDKYADLLIHSYVDDVLARVIELLGVEIPEYVIARDPVLITRKRLTELQFAFDEVPKDGSSLVEYPTDFDPIEWTVPDECVRDIDLMNKMLKKKRNAPEEDEDLCFCPKKIHAKDPSKEELKEEDKTVPKSEKNDTDEEEEEEEDVEEEEEEEEDEDDDDDDVKEIEKVEPKTQESKGENDVPKPIQKEDSKHEENCKDSKGEEKIIEYPNFKRESSVESTYGTVFDLSYKKDSQNYYEAGNEVQRY